MASGFKSKVSSLSPLGPSALFVVHSHRRELLSLLPSEPPEPPVPPDPPEPPDLSSPLRLPSSPLFVYSAPTSTVAPLPDSPTPCLSVDGSSISDESLSRVFILFEYCSDVEPKYLSRLSSSITVSYVVVMSLKMFCRSMDTDGIEFHFQTSSTRNIRIELYVLYLAFGALFSLQNVHGDTRVLFGERIVSKLVAFPFVTYRNLEDGFFSVKVLGVISLGDVQLSPTYNQQLIVGLSGRCTIRLPSHTVVTPSCLATTFIFPPSPRLSTLSPAAPFLRLLISVIDCLRKLMLVIIFIEPITVTMSILVCSVMALVALLDEYSRTGVYGSTLLDQVTFMECIPLMSDQACKCTSIFHTYLNAPWSRGLLPRLSSSARVFHTLSSRGSLFSLVLVSTNRSQTLLIGPLIVGSYTDPSVFLRISVSGFQVKHLYGFLSNNSTLARAISGNLQSKEIFGLVKGIRLISSGFAAISFYFVVRSDNLVTDCFSKRLSKPSSLCNGHHDLSHRFGFLSLL